MLSSNNKKKVFCRNIICRKSQRRKCCKCGIYVCKRCSFYNNEKKRYCIDCGIKKFVLKEEYLKDFFECVLP